MKFSGRAAFLFGMPSAPNESNNPHMKEFSMKAALKTLSIACAMLAGAALSAADFHDWAPTPPMGWNSFDCFGLSLTEAQAKEQAEAMIKLLKPFGWDVFVIDHQWYNDNQRGFQSDARHQVSMDEYPVSPNSLTLTWRASARSL